MDFARDHHYSEVPHRPLVSIAVNADQRSAFAGQGKSGARCPNQIAGGNGQPCCGLAALFLPRNCACTAEEATYPSARNP